MPAVRVIGALQGREVFCREKTGIFEGSIIRCKCCNKDFAPSAFEHHSGSSFRRPWKSIKDINGKSIQEYRDEQEVSQVDALEAHKEDNSLVESILSSRVRQGAKEYLVKWENFDASYNSWVPADSFSVPQLVERYEAQKKLERKRKSDPLEKAAEILKQARRSSNVSPPQPDYSPGREAASSPSQPLSPSDEDLDRPALEPLFADASHVYGDVELSESDDSSEDEPDYLALPGDSDNEPEIPIVSTITVDYERMKGTFIQVNTFRDLLDCALEYWEMNELTTPKDWVLTNEKGAMWPLSEGIRTYSPEVVYLKRKPWR